MYSIDASCDGSFALNNCLTLPQHITLQVQLHSKELFTYTPLLCTSLPLPPKQLKSPSRPVKGQKSILRGDTQPKYPFMLSQKHTTAPSTIGNDGNYIFIIKTSVVGPHYLRILWQNKSDLKIYKMGVPLYFQVETHQMNNLPRCTLQTVLPNLVETWDHNGYDGFHLCPIQEFTRSLYAITDQLSIKHFESLKHLQDFVKESNKLFFVDVVLNHTSTESEWLHEEECVYNERTVPQLTSALELDIAIQGINAYESIQPIITELRLEEYFMLSQDITIEQSVFSLEDPDDDNMFKQPSFNKVADFILKQAGNLGVKRYGVSFDVKQMEEFIKLHAIDEVNYNKGIVLANKQLVDIANGYINEAIRNTQEYFKTVGNVPKYFHKLKNWYAAYNGWVLNLSPDENFVTSLNFHYLRRTIQHWAVVKLRYGVDTPKLYDRMSKYICMMASAFHGIRLDNAHSTPIEVAKYLLKQARIANSNLMVFAEYFGANQSQKVKIISVLGLNSLVKDLAHGTTTDYIVNQIKQKQIVPFIKPPQHLVYDQSHDNKSILSKYGGKHLVAIVTALSFSNVFKGTTRMVDQFYDNKVCVAYEDNKYPQQQLDTVVVNRRAVTITYTSSTVVNSVQMKGSFDNWQVSYQLQQVVGNDNNMYQYDIELDVGEYEYKFIVDNQWIMDSNKPNNGNNNVIVIEPIECHKQMTFIRQLPNKNLPYCYIDHTDDVIIMTRASEDHTIFQVAVICCKYTNAEYSVVGPIQSIHHHYSYAFHTYSTIQDGYLPQPHHFIDLTTNYAAIHGNIIKITNAPQSFVAILNCIPSEHIQSLNKFLNSPVVLDLQILYKPIHHEYVIPNCGRLIYAGLYGIYQYITKLESTEDPLIKHIKDGDWLIDFLITEHPDIRIQLQSIKQLPTSMKPYYFISCINHIVYQLETKCSQNQESFFRQMDINRQYFRNKNWDKAKGRDTFISFKGLLLSTGNFITARHLLLKFGELELNGLIPNAINPPRYNTRDTCFWWIRSLRDYINLTSDYTILTELQDRIQNIFQAHANGIDFKESRVQDSTDRDGQRIKLSLNEETGFIFGGSYKNALTWMDKIGSSQLNYGIPAASRDGAPIECTALLKVALDFLHRMNNMGKYPYSGIKYQNRTITWKTWSGFICAHFERCYWVPYESSKFIEYEINDKYVRRRGIYKDIYNCSKPRSEYQLRPNSCIAIALAPELFQRQHVIHHLALIEQYLMGQNSVGISTLDSIASEYAESLTMDDTSKFATSQGFSIHNGSEFPFLMGFFLKALIRIHNQAIPIDVFYAYLSPLKQLMKTNYGIPNFTNSNGQPCPDADINCPYSLALIFEAIHDFQLIQ